MESEWSSGMLSFHPGNLGSNSRPSDSQLEAILMLRFLRNKNSIMNQKKQLSLRFWPSRFPYEKKALQSHTKKLVTILNLFLKHKIEAEIPSIG